MQLSARKNASPPFGSRLRHTVFDVASAFDLSLSREVRPLIAYRYISRRLVFASLALLFVAYGLPQAVRGATVTTLAGSGKAGFADGPARSASFMLPVGVAWGTKGQLYVADAAAQRLRVVLPDGSVRTVAGSGQPASTGLWVPGGYADGNGAAARFNTPMGIAVGPNDDVFVADARNHCIRRVTPNGAVTTFAGSPSRNSGLGRACRAGRFQHPGRRRGRSPRGRLRSRFRGRNSSHLARRSRQYASGRYRFAHRDSRLPSEHDPNVVGRECGWIVAHRPYGVEHARPGECRGSISIRWFSISATSARSRDSTVTS